MKSGKQLLVALCIVGSLSLGGPSRAQIAENTAAQSLPAAYCTRVMAPDVLELDGVGIVKLLGVHSPAVADFCYGKVLAATRKFTEQRNVRVDFCQVRGTDEESRLRAIVYYAEGDKWFNLNTKLLRSGLVAAVIEPSCHVNTESWVALVKDAKARHRGVFFEGGDMLLVFRSEVPFAVRNVGKPHGGFKTDRLAGLTRTNDLFGKGKLIAMSRPSPTILGELAGVSSATSGSEVLADIQITDDGEKGSTPRKAAGRKGSNSGRTLLSQAPAGTPAKEAVKGEEPLWREFKPARPDDVEVRYVGSIQSRHFHRLNCGVGPRELDRVFFPTRLQALKKHYKPCVVCRP
ncbi:MAG: hypothetical protein HY318_20035 [Armatimonadetes bacterium]|nr:hypothetical protein [Armatimonadota bacterium]